MGVVDATRGAVELTRPVNAIAAGMLTFIGAFVAGGIVDSLLMVLAAIGATVLATGAGNTINDYFDREIDVINRPNRPIPRGAVTPQIALAQSGLLFTGAVILAIHLPPLAILIAVVNLVALVMYTKVFKGLPGVGNAIVAALGGSTFLFGGAAVGRIDTVSVLFVLAALATFTREIIKDVEDMAGDRSEGLNTLPLLIGERRALWIGVVCLVIAVIASPVPFFLGTFGYLYLFLVLPADIIMIFAVYESFGDPAAGQRHMKIGMFLAAIAFIVGRVTTIFV